MAIMSVQAIKGVEVGDAFENAKRIGTQAHDPINLRPSTFDLQPLTMIHYRRDSDTLYNQLIPNITMTWRKYAT
jgi:hypothetical protein